MPKKVCAPSLKNALQNSGEMMTPHAKAQPPTEIDLVRDDTLRQFLGYHLKRTSNDILADLAKTLKPFDLRMLTYTALVLIVDNPGMRQFQLADAMDVERSNLVVLLDELERRDLIVRDKVPTDRRAYALRPTLTGRKLYEKAVKAVRNHEKALLAGTDPKQINDLISLLRQIRLNLSES